MDYLSFLSTLIVTVASYPSGPPTSACVDMLPGTQMGSLGLEGHTTQPQNVWPIYGNSKTPPYYIKFHASSATYTPNGRFNVSIIANQSTSDMYYIGILMMARKVKCVSSGLPQVETTPIGTFSLPSCTSSCTLLTTMACNDISNSAVSHKSPQFKINEMVTWQAPATAQGHLIFKATIVKEATIYWTDVYSAVIKDASDSSQLVTCSSSRLTASLWLLPNIMLLLSKFV